MIKAITGTKDILPLDISKWQYLEKLLRETFRLFNYKEIRTPIFEETALFARGIGEETDIVSKEMYTFKDRSETSITLRPENTAGVVRSFIEQSLGAQQSLNKLVLHRCDVQTGKTSSRKAETISSVWCRSVGKYFAAA